MLFNTCILVLLMIITRKITELIQPSILNDSTRKKNNQYIFDERNN